MRSKQRPEKMDNLHQQDLPFFSSHPGPVMVTLDIDADVLAFLQEKPFWRREINDLLRFTMETHLIREAAFEDAASGDEGDF
jgi:uncharacterized protein (DUF4415 family)